MKKIVCIIWTFAFLASCSKSPNQSGSSTASKGLMPLNVGNSWNFKYTIYDSVTHNPDSVAADTITIIEQIGINNITYYQVVVSSYQINGPNFLSNIDSNTLQKIDSATKYVFFKRVASDSLLVASWADTVHSRCPGHNDLIGFTQTYTINGYANCLKNVVNVVDCTGNNFEKWVYYLQPELGLVRIEDSAIQNNNAFWLRSIRDLQSYRVIP